MLERWREGNGRVRSRDPPGWRVEVLEGFFCDRRRDLARRNRRCACPRAARAPSTSSAPSRERSPCPRAARAQIDDLDRDVAQFGRGLLCRVDHRAPGDECDVLSLPMDARLADRDRVALVGHFPFDSAIEVLVLEEEDGVRILDRRDEQALGVGRRGGADALQSGDVGERRLGVLGVERARRRSRRRTAAAARSAPASRRASAAWPRP